MEKTVIITIVLIASVLLIRCLVRAFCGETGSSCCSGCSDNAACKKRKESRR